MRSEYHLEAFIYLVKFTKYRSTNIIAWLLHKIILNSTCKIFEHTPCDPLLPMLYTLSYSTITNICSEYPLWSHALSCSTITNVFSDTYSDDLLSAACTKISSNTFGPILSHKLFISMSSLHRKKSSFSHTTTRIDQHIDTHIHKHTYRQTHTYTDTHIYRHTHTHTDYRDTQTHTYTQDKHIDKHTHTHEHTHIDKDTHIHRHTPINRQTHTQTQTHTYKHMHIDTRA